MQQPVQGLKAVIVGNGQELPVTHIGNDELRTLTHNFRLDNILRVPDLASNLLSVHKLCLQNNVFCYFDAHKFLIQDLPTGKILYAGLSKDGVYPIPSNHNLSSTSYLNSVQNSTFVTVKPHHILLWHHRLGHPSSKILLSALKPVFPSISLSQIDDVCSSCEFCISAKMHRFHLNKTPLVSTSLLELVHGDVWGPSPLTSLLSFNYYVIFVDDYSRFTWLFLLKHKNEVLSVFKHFKSMVETQFNSKLKILRTDNGSEYINNDFKSFCSISGILHQSSYPHTPEQNGVLERKHRHIVETGLTLLYQSHLPLNYWSYAFSATTYLINRMPSLVLGFHSPWEKVYSKPPSLHALKAFGCACYPYLRPFNQNKLQPRSKPCVFLGYPPLSKGYICLDPTSNRIYIDCHVLFNESLYPFAHDSSFTDPHLPFSSSLSNWLSPSTPNVDEFVHTSSIESATISTPPDLTSSLLPSFLSSSIPIPVVPPPLTIPSSIPTSLPSTAPPLSSSQTIPSVSESNAIVPISNNSHPMLTRSKHGIYKPRVMQVQADYTIIEPPSFTIASKHSQ